LLSIHKGVTSSVRHCCNLCGGHRIQSILSRSFPYPSTPATALACSRSSRALATPVASFGSWDSQYWSLVYLFFGTLAFDAIVILYASARNCTFVSIVLLRLCCRLNRSPVSASQPAVISFDRSLWESTCLARHSCDRCVFFVDACVGRLCHAIFALLLFGSVVYAEYTSRQSPVHSPALLSLRSMPFAIDFPQQITCFGPATPAIVPL
jgi:hypothetical protein